MQTSVAAVCGHNAMRAVGPFSARHSKHRTACARPRTRSPWGRPTGPISFSPRCPITSPSLSSAVLTPSTRTICLPPATTVAVTVCRVVLEAPGGAAVAGQVGRTVLLRRITHARAVRRRSGVCARRHSNPLSSTGVAARTWCAWQGECLGALWAALGTTKAHVPSRLLKFSTQSELGWLQQWTDDSTTALATKRLKCRRAAEAGQDPAAHRVRDPRSCHRPHASRDPLED